MSAEDVLDALVIGAGPAGLTAATSLARLRRRPESHRPHR